MVKLNGAFQFVAGESESDCAIFFIGDVDEIVSLTITELNMRDSCNQQDEYVKVSFRSDFATQGLHLATMGQKPFLEALAWIEQVRAQRTLDPPFSLNKF